MEPRYANSNKKEGTLLRRRLSNRIGRPLVTAAFILQSVLVSCNHSKDTGQQKTSNQLVERLKGNEFEVRRKAALRLIAIGQPALPALKMALKDEDEEMRRWAAWILGEMKSLAAAKVVIDALSDKSIDVRREGTNALVKLGEPAIPLLADVLKKGSKDARWEAVMALESIGGSSAKRVLRSALADADPEIRLKAAKSIEKLAISCPSPDQEATTSKDDLKDAIIQGRVSVDSHAASAFLTKMLNDKQESISNRIWAAGMLGKAKDALAIRVLAKAVTNDDKQIQRKCADALAEIGQPAVRDLADILQIGNRFARMEAVRALGKIGGAPAIDALRHAMGDIDPGVREKALGVLGKMIVDPAVWEEGLTSRYEEVRTVSGEALKKFRRLLKDRDENIRFQAVSALASSRSPSAKGLLRKALWDKSEMVRLEAAEALAKRQDALAIPHLGRWLGDGTSDKDSEIIRVLGKFKHPSAVAILRRLLIKDRDKEDVVRNWRWAVFESLESIGKISTYVWIEALNNRHSQVRERAAVVLGNLKAVSAIVPLLNRLRVEKINKRFSVREQIVNALENIGKPTVPYLRRALGDGNIDLRIAAVSVLGKLEAASALDDLNRVLKFDSDEHVRYWAAWAIGAIGNPRSVPLLDDRLKREKSVKTREGIIWAIGAIGGDGARKVLTKFLSTAKGQNPSLVLKAQRALKHMR